MKAILFGATGMVGQGVLRELLLDPQVEQVLLVTRTATGRQDPKLRELVHRDFTDYGAIAAELGGYDACFFCLGISSVGMTEADYRRVTFDYAVAAARALLARNPQLTFLFVSGGGTDSTEKGPSMWARVKGQTENALRAMPFRSSYMFRPGFIQPRHGIRSRTRWLRVMYAVLGPLYPLFRLIFPRYVTTTELLGRAMIGVARHGAPTPVLENQDINVLAQALPAA